ncbi:siderophore-iron reductase FhuF [Enterobacter cloacae S611]|uniref:Siderophore-iron reductase FhuF n=1 Tax=Enterobacter cloacae S611 TaxID=1399146 RepID=A0ABN0Q734_ENTCL|nr:siderophore-iron reductase FhuF [Enterobacter cloacae S611]
MAYRTASITQHVIWQSPLHDERDSLATAMRDAIASTRAHLLDFLRLNEDAPHQAMTLAEWSRPTALSSLIATYSDHIYRNNPTQPRESKPLLSLWAQWYLGLMVPPLLLTLLTQKNALDLDPDNFHVEFHESGRAACFWIDVQQDHSLTLKNDAERIAALVTQSIQPVIKALEATGDINGKLIWSNTGYLINWYLGEMMPLIGEARLAALRQICFFEKSLADGSDNPLWRTVVLRDGALVRRTCCQRYRLPDVQQCGDCTLK